MSRLTRLLGLLGLFCLSPLLAGLYLLIRYDEQHPC